MSDQHQICPSAKVCELCGVKHRYEHSRKFCIYYREYLVWGENAEIKPYLENGTDRTMPGWERFEGHLDKSYLWAFVSSAVLRRDDHKCTNCGHSHNLEVHHIVGRFRGGTDNPENLRSLCESCHKKVTFGEQLFERTRISRKVQPLEGFE